MNLGKRIIAFVSALTLVTMINLPLTVSVHAANADGSITKTATRCSGGTYKTVTCSGTVSSKGMYSIESFCSTCGKQLCVYKYECSSCLLGYHAYDAPSSSSFCWTCYCNGKGTLPSSTINYSHTRSEQDKPCSHGGWSSHYYSEAYGYSGSSSTFKVWPITVNYIGGLASTIVVTGATATDAAMQGKTVTITPSGAAGGTKIKITNSALGETKEVLVGSSYSFTMPAAATTLTVELGKQPQTIAVQSTFNVAYNQAPFNLNAIVTA